MMRFTPLESLYRIEIKCKTCSKILMYNSDEYLQDKICDNCGNNIGAKIIYHIDDGQDVSSETHIRYKWFCNKCESKGMKWIEKGLRLKNCPKCDSPIQSTAIKQINSDAGLCKTIWDSSMDMRNIVFSKNISDESTKGECHSCGYEYSFKVIPPYCCVNCGGIGENFRP